MHLFWSDSTKASKRGRPFFRWEGKIIEVDIQ
jgi:hypothetical protein